MTLPSLHNHRNFLSDYWLGTLTASRRAAGPRLAPTEVVRRLRRLSRLVDAIGGDGVEPARFRERFARPLLSDVFDFHLLDEEVAPRIHLARPRNDEGAPPVVAVCLSPDPAGLDRPAVRSALEGVLAERSLSHGLILTPQVLRLVRRAGDGPRLGALDLSLLTLRELQDDASLQVAYRLLSAGCFVPDGDGRRPIEILEAESREHSAKVSTELKATVFEAAERLVGAFQRDVTSRAGDFAPEPPSLAQVRDAGFLALYRILFILYAEARDERLAAHRLYRDSYGLDGLIRALLEVPPDSLPGNRVRFWARLQVLFRVFRDGLTPNLPGFENIPPRGGRLFSSATPDGALLERLRVDDRTLRDVLLAIATTRPRRGVGRERVSFRELEIEQLGSVYEGLLEYEPAVASELSLEVRVGGREVVVSPEELVLLCERKRLVLAGDPSLVTGTAAEMLHPANVPENNEEEEDGEDGKEELGEDQEEAPEGDGSLRAGQPIRLLRRLEPGAFHFRPGGARKASGSFYTPTPMVNFLVREALGPLTEGRTAEEIERLRVVDIACGSAHFLVGAARFLGERLHGAYTAELGGEPPPGFLPPDSPRGAARARWETEGLTWCRRRIVERCLYGVDLNPAAVQLAQVALWIESLAGDRPLSFFAHHVRVGNSLLGTFADRFNMPPDPRFAPNRADTGTLLLFESRVRDRIEAALGERRLIDAELPPEIRSDTPEEFEYKEHRLRRSQEALAHARLLLDLRSASPFLPAIWADLPHLSDLADPEPEARRKAWWADFERVRERERFFHWELEFPEVMLRADRPGFDAVLGNPPWDKVRPSRVEFYARFDPLVPLLAGHELDRRIATLHGVRPELESYYQREQERTITLARVLRASGDFPLAAEAGSGQANEDLSKYFVDRSLRLVREGGAVGLLVPSVVYNGDGCVGIRQHLLNRTAIQAFYAFENRRKIFPIDSRYKFANLVARAGAEGDGGFEAAFMRHQVSELTDTGPKPWMVRMTKTEVAEFSPATLAFLEFRGPKDQAITRRMTAARPTFGGNEAGSWGTRLFSWGAHELIYHAAIDKDLWAHPTTVRLHTPTSVLGPGAPEDPGALVEAMRQAGYWPVYEGKHIEQYLVGVKPVRWWVSVAQAKAKYGRGPREAPTLVFRETASNTNQRTCIAAVLPAGAAASHKLTGVLVEHVETDAALVVLNSKCFDFLLRLRSAGTNVSFTYIRPVAVPPAAVTNALPRIPTRFAPAAGIKQITDDPAALPALWAAERAVAEAYGLGPEEFAHILETFPVWLRKRPAAAEFYRARLEEWRREAATR